MKRSLTVALALSLGACSHQPRSYVFETTRPPDEAFDLVARRLEQEGHKLGELDRRDGLIATLWERADARLAGASSGASQAAVLVRYHVELKTIDVEHRVRVWAEFQRCAGDTFSVTSTEVLGACQDAGAVPAVAESELTQFGERLSAALSWPPGAAAASVASTAPRP